MTTCSISFPHHPAARRDASFNYSLSLPPPIIRSYQRTSICRKTVAPQWDEEFRFEVTEDAALQNEPIEFKVGREGGLGGQKGREGGRNKSSYIHRREAEISLLTFILSFY